MKIIKLLNSKACVLHLLPFLITISYKPTFAVVDVIKLFFGGNLDFPKIKKLNIVCSNI